MGDPQEFRDNSGEIPVHGFLHLPNGTIDGAIVLTHGAGANCNAPLLITLANSFCVSGFAVVRCDLPFRQLRPHGPPPRGSAERDQQGLRSAVRAIQRDISARAFLGGHSYGGRQASMLAATQPDLVEALLLLSYPLHPPQRPADMRTSHFPRLKTPALFVHGTRDGFGSLAEMEHALKLIPGRTQLNSVDGSGHELMSKHNRNELPQLIVDAFRAFVGN